MSDKSNCGWLRKLSWLIVGGGLGVLVAGGAVMALQATDKPGFCVQCHVMDEAAVTHQRSIHARQTCNDCHMPQGWEYLPAKTIVGLADVYHNFLGSVPDQLHATAWSKDTIQANCLRCHGATLEQVTIDVKTRCVDCHRQTPHQRTTPISLRKAADA